MRFMKLTAPLLLLTACTSPRAEVQRVLKGAGYTDIQTGGAAPLACGTGLLDPSMEFTAKNPTGQTVKGYVCCGAMFKGCTIRY
jgi:hypothetical protein